MTKEDHMTYPERLKTIDGPDGRRLFDIYVYDESQIVCIHSLQHDLDYELEWHQWIKISDLLLQKLQQHK